MSDMDREVSKLVRSVFDRAVFGLVDDPASQQRKGWLAVLLLNLAAAGERNPGVLRAAAKTYLRAERADAGDKRGDPLTAAALIEVRQASLNEAEACARKGLRGMPALERPIFVIDHSSANRQLRSMRFNPGSKDFNLIVRSVNRYRREIEQINLFAPDADERLSRYSLVESPSRQIHSETLADEINIL
jgi:hypothetical protein